MKKAQSISINTVIIAAIALVVLIILVMIFTGKSQNPECHVLGYGDVKSKDLCAVYNNLQEKIDKKFQDGHWECIENSTITHNLLVEYEEQCDERCHILIYDYGMTQLWGFDEECYNNCTESLPYIESWNQTICTKYHLIKEVPPLIEKIEYKYN